MGVATGSSPRASKSVWRARGPLARLRSTVPSSAQGSVGLRGRCCRDNGSQAIRRSPRSCGSSARWRREPSTWRGVARRHRTPTSYASLRLTKSPGESLVAMLVLRLRQRCGGEEPSLSVRCPITVDGRRLPTIRVSLLGVQTFGLDRSRVEPNVDELRPCPVSTLRARGPDRSEMKRLPTIPSRLLGHNHDDRLWLPHLPRSTTASPGSAALRTGCPHRRTPWQRHHRRTRRCRSR